MNDNKTFKVRNKDNEIITLSIILTFDDNDTNESYVIYTDNTYTLDGKLNVYASKYDSRLNNPILNSNLSEDEWNTIKTIIDNLKLELNRS